MSTANINIQVNFQQILEAVKQMSPAEKIKLNEVIWDESTRIPVEHQQLVLGRIEKAKVDPERLLNWEEVSKNLG